MSVSFTFNTVIKMNHYRCILEALKLCAPADVLECTSVVSRDWTAASSSEELWCSLGEDRDYLSHRKPEESWKSVFERKVAELQQRVGLIFAKHYWLFNPIDISWKKIHVGKRLPQSRTGAANLFLPDDGFLSCGGGVPPMSSVTRVRNTTITKVNSMLTPRSYHGIIKFRGEVFVFGGKLRLQDHALRTCEKISLAALDKDAWTPLPDMISPRCHFTVCKDANLIYLCGGFTRESETFCPATGKFSPLPFHVPDVTMNCSLLVEDALLVFGQRFVTSCSIPVSLTTVNRIFGFIGHATGNLVVADGVVYLVDVDRILTYDVHHPFQQTRRLFPPKDTAKETRWIHRKRR